MATSTLLSCVKCHHFKPPFRKAFFRGLVVADQRCVSFRLPLCKTSSVLFCYKSDQLFRPSPFNSLEKCHQFATIAEIESKQFLKRRLTYFNLLIKIEGLDGVVLDNFSQFIISTSKMMNLSVTKKFNLTTERFSQTLAFPPESYKKQSITYHLKKHGRMIEIGEVPVEKSDIYIQYLQENTPVGVSVKMELIISSLNTRLPCYSLLVKFEGLNATVLDNFSLFVINAAKARNLQLRKRINLKPTDFKDNQILFRPIDSYEKHRATFQLNKTGRISLFFRYNLTSEYFKEEPSKPPSQYKKISKTYHFNKKGQIIKVAKIPFDETHLFIQNLWDNIPSGVSLHMELVKDEY